MTRARQELYRAGGASARPDADSPCRALAATTPPSSAVRSRRPARIPTAPSPGPSGSLKGPLHGGANCQGASRCSARSATPSALRRRTRRYGACLDDLLDSKTGDGSGKLYGLGHAVYTDVRSARHRASRSMPRRWPGKQATAVTICAADGARRRARNSEDHGAKASEAADVRQCRSLFRPHLSTCSTCRRISITPLFATARIAGWCAHRMEEVVTGEPHHAPGLPRRGGTSGLCPDGEAAMICNGICRGQCSRSAQSLPLRGRCRAQRDG